RLQRVRPLAEAGAANGRAELAVVLPVTGSYTLVANAAAPGQQGAYAINARAIVQAEAEAPSVVAKVASPRLLDAGTTATGQFAKTDPTFQDGTGYQTWLFDGTEGERVRVTMRSAEVDPYLILAEGTPSAPRKLAENDDAPGEANGTAQIEIVLPTTGTYTVFANTARPGVGRYTLDLTSEGGETAPARPSSAALNYAERYPGGGPEDGRYAVLVGISEYPPGSTDLAAPIYDARLMRDFLIEHMDYDPDDLVLLTDEEATREHILQALGRHLGQAGPDGTVLFYYSGHGGYTYSNVAIGPPLDVEPDGRDETLSVWSSEGAATDILDDEIRLVFDALPARRKLLVFDSCHSGTAARGGYVSKSLDRLVVETEQEGGYTDPAAYLSESDLPAYGLASKTAASNGTVGASSSVDAALDGFGRPYVLLSGSESDHSSYSYSGWPASAGRGRHVSAFTYFLLDALEAFAAVPDPELTFAALMGQVRPETEAFMDSLGVVQRPHVSGSLQALTLAEFFGR
ncbi:MAG: caspase family protein, partial [Bacteroidota bacterium]